MKPVKNNLVALGSAAVFTVYAAGFLRTKEAADRFAGEDAGRTRPVASTEHDPGTPPPLRPADQPPSQMSDTPSADTRAESAKVLARSPKVQVTGHPVDSAATPHAAVVDSATQPQVVVPTPATPAPATPIQAATLDAQAADTSTQKKEAQFKDGIYSGWGTSRHGDIQASVEIRDGRIVTASITQCLTRYSCSWISHLPGQVVSRQSPNVDYVSGATQSTNAFYYAIVEALSKAK